MIKFFRIYRKNLIDKGKTVNYIKYALGEIVLVVIGILIALQINNWNVKRLDHDKEYKYLNEIKSNLKSDLVKLRAVVDFNLRKDSSIVECLGLLEIRNTTPGPLIFGPRLDILGSYDYFYPNDLGFKNLMSAENIGLIENDSLRKLLLEYYSFDFETGVQKRAEEVTRKFIDYILPKISTKDFFLKRNNIELDLPPNNEVQLKNDPQLISYLFLMQVIVQIQNDLLIYQIEKIEKLIENVQNQLKYEP